MMYNQKKTKSVVLPWTIFSPDHQSIAYSYFESYLIYIGCIILALKSAISTLLIWGCDGLRGLRAQQKISYSFCPPPLVHCYQKIRSWFPYVLLLKRGGYILQHSLFGRSLVCQWWLYHIGSTRFGWSEQPLYCWWHIYMTVMRSSLSTLICFFPSAEFHRERPLHPESSSHSWATTRRFVLLHLVDSVTWTPRFENLFDCVGSEATGA